MSTLNIVKGMPTIHRSQEFQSQRYLLLTTVATFLSSVTATTLQITATDSDDISILSQTMNSLWLISLVFSTASAVFSLLIMTWHQSHVYVSELIMDCQFLTKWIIVGSPINRCPHGHIHYSKMGLPLH